MRTTPRLRVLWVFQLSLCQGSTSRGRPVDRLPAAATRCSCTLACPGRCVRHAPSPAISMQFRVPLKQHLACVLKDSKPQSTLRTPEPTLRSPLCCFILWKQREVGLIEVAPDAVALEGLPATPHTRLSRAASAPSRSPQRTSPPVAATCAAHRAMLPRPHLRGVRPFLSLDFKVCKTCQAASFLGVYT